jgi:hypothetical protein
MSNFFKSFTEARVSPHFPQSIALEFDALEMSL